MAFVDHPPVIVEPALLRQVFDLTLDEGQISEQILHLSLALAKKIAVSFVNMPPGKNIFLAEIPLVSGTKVVDSSPHLFRIHFERTLIDALASQRIRAFVREASADSQLLLTFELLPIHGVPFIGFGNREQRLVGKIRLYLARAPESPQPTPAQPNASGVRNFLRRLLFGGRQI